MVSLLNPGHPFKQDYYTDTAAQVRPYSMKELCNLYEVTSKTLYRWLEPFSKDIGCRRGRFYTVVQVEMIFLKLGVPYMLKEKR